MKFLFYIILFVVLIILQTAILPNFYFFSKSFDLLIVNILYMSMVFSSPWLLVVVVIQGCIMDSISGTPFGLYMSVYLWICVSVQVMKRFVHPGNIIFVSVVSALSVFVENCFIVFFFFVRYGELNPSFQDIILMAEQMVGAFFIAPVMVLLIHIMQKKWGSFVDKLSDNGMKNI